MLSPDDLPSPETLIDYGSGSCAAAMFHYAPAETDLAAVADEHGFDIVFISMEGDVSEEEMDLFLDDKRTLNDWQPNLPPGWILGGKFDHEDGPFAMLMYRREAEEIEPTVADVGTA